ncbi:MAG: hypothetical protein JWN08_1579 [Frankiales bacterium]|nr:hypothetical protein [Frankiales bacterium]
MAVLLAVVLLGGIASAAVVDEPAPDPVVPGAASGPALAVELVSGDTGLPDGAETGVAVEASGELGVVVTNLRPARVRLGSLTLVAPGLRVLSVQPGFGRPLGAGESRDYRLSYAVPVCAALQLPAALRLSYLQDGRPAQSVSLPLGPGLQPVPFALCPEGATREVRPDLAVRTIGGTDTRRGDGVRGTVALEVRNADAPLQLLSVTAEVPGVRFTDRGPANGITLGTDDRVEVRLGFEVDDCALLRRTGRLVLTVRQDGVVRELALTLTTETEAGVIRQLALDRVLESCS